MSRLKRLPLRAGLIAILAVGASACEGFFVDPAPAEPGQVQLTYSWVPELLASAQDLDTAYGKVNQARVRLSGGFTLDTTLAFDGSGAETTLSIEIPAEAGGTVAVQVDLMQGSEPVFTGTGQAEIATGQTTSIAVEIAPVATEVVLPDAVPPIDALGEQLQLTAAIVVATGDTIEGLTFDWQSTNPQVASVTQTGLVSGIDEGSAFVIAAFDRRSDNVRIDVQAAVASIEITPPTITLGVSEERVMIAQAKDRNGNDLNRTFTWSVSDESVASITASGRLTALSSGTTTITAEAGGVSGTATLTVN